MWLKLVVDVVMDGYDPSDLHARYRWPRDTTARRLCLERIAPPRKERTLGFELSDVTGVEDVPPALARVIRAVATGALTPGERPSA